MVRDSGRTGRQDSGPCGEEGHLHPRAQTKSPSGDSVSKVEEPKYRYPISPTDLADFFAEDQDRVARHGGHKAVLALLRGCVPKGVPHNEAGGIVSEAFLRAWTARGAFKGGDDADKFCAWLIRIVRNCGVDYFRREHTDGRVELTPELCGTIPDDAPTAIEKLETTETLAAVSEQIGEDTIERPASSVLSQLERDALRFVGYHSMGPKEIAERLNRSPTEIENTLFRARQKLRAMAIRTGLIAPGEHIVSDSRSFAEMPVHRAGSPGRHMSESEAGP
jgi:RNA polymerase sigma factor (sigma-70 family)